MANNQSLSNKPDQNSESIYDLVSFRMSMVSNSNERTGQLWLSRKHGLTLTEFRLLALINTHGSATSNTLRRITLLDKGQLSRTIKRLKTLNYIQATADTENLRSPLLELTQEGEEKYKPIFKSVVKQNNLILENITQEESEQLFAILLKMQPYFDRRLVEEEAFKNS